MTTKEQFLEDHNTLASVNLKATMSMLLHFKKEKPALFKDGDYPTAKIRRPFIFWLTSLSDEQKAEMNA